MIRLFVPDALVAGAAVAVPGEQAHYLVNVMRLAVGADVHLFNGRDGEWRATLAAAARRSAVLTVAAQTAPMRLPPDLDLIVALVKRSRLETIVEKAAELGARRVRLVTTRRTNAGHTNVARLQAIAIEAAEQTGRLDVPDILDPEPLGRLLDGWAPPRRLMFCDEAGDDLQARWGGEAGRAGSAVRVLAGQPRQAPWAVLIGPEGGFDPAERDRLRSLPFVTAVTLGPRILRADTAAIAALTLWQAALGDWGKPGPDPRRTAVWRGVERRRHRPYLAIADRGDPMSDAAHAPGGPMAEAKVDAPPLRLEDLAGYLAGGCRSPSEFKVGAEHEKFGFRQATLQPIPYEGPDGVEALLKGLMRFGWKGDYEARDGGETLIALTRNGASISLEPGGQFELSGAPLATMHDICCETSQHLKETKAVADELGIGFLGIGFSPVWRVDEVPVMPKGRYTIMREYMPKVGTRGLDMMFRTCTVQANLDFASEADMVKKFRVSLALQPVATALFANSPFTEGRPNGWLSARGAVWTDVDADRTGLLDFVFEEGFGFETYARYAIDVPMYFAKRNGRYVDLSGRSFRRFMAGALAELPGERPTMKDWGDHLTTLFPEVRLKTYLEMRGADSGPQSSLCALPALWTGVLYDDAALEAAWDLCKAWSTEDRLALRVDAARQGLKATVAGRSLQAVARDMTAIAREGLKRRGRLNGGMLDETVFLNPVSEVAESGITPAERLLELYHGPWQGDVDRVFELAY